MTRRGPERAVNTGDVVLVKEGVRINERFYGEEGVVIKYHPATSTAWGSYITVEFPSGETRRLRPAEVKVVHPELEDLGRVAPTDSYWRE